MSNNARWCDTTYTKWCNTSWAKWCPVIAEVIGRVYAKILDIKYKTTLDEER